MVDLQRPYNYQDTSTVVEGSYLVCDTVRWRDVVAKHSAEELRELVKQFQQVVGAAAAEVGAEPAPSGGHADAAHFVYPIERVADAVRGAIGIHERVGSRLAELGLQMSIGITTGEAVIVKNKDYMGPNIVRARSLALAADAGAIFCDAATRTHLEGAELRSSRGAVTLLPARHIYMPAFTHPLEYHEVQWTEQPVGPKPHRVAQSAERERLAHESAG